VFLAACILIGPFRDWIEASSQDETAWLQTNLLLSALVYLYFMLFFGPWGTGQTPGYRLLHLKLVDQKTRQSPSWLQSLLWCAGSVIILFGWIFYWFDRQHRMLHNGISKTIVLKLPS
jgi:uncharacterized RDD family membrane protein YckC